MNQQKSSLQVSPLIPWSYDVFLSFRGEDVRKTFVDHLYVALQQKGIYTFKDDEKLEKGKSISPDLVKAIEESRIALIIFSENYANSTWCLDELTNIMECKNVKGQIVLPVFYDVDPSTVRKQKKKALEKHLEIMKTVSRCKNGEQHWRKQLIYLAGICQILAMRKKKTAVTRILESYNFSPVIGIKVLMEKSLITISKGRILVHQLIQEMGWHIVRREASDNPRRYSRLWMSKDISHVLARNMGTENIEGISLNLTNTEEINVIRTAFIQMTRLRFLKLKNACVCQGPDFLPGELRWLDWHRYPSKIMPISFQGELLVGLKLKNSRIIQLWKVSKVLWNLKYINLSHSQKLIRTPDFSGTPNLEMLVLEECTSLVEIKFSVKDLGKLVLLNLKNCRNLKTLPKSIQLESLEVLILSGCLKLKTFPEIKEKMNCLSELYLEGTALRELPASIENLSGVSLINLSYCKHLENLPSSIFRLKCLRRLALSGCSRLEILSDDVGLLVVLEELHCDGTAIRTIPSSISLLKNLKHLSFGGFNALGLQVGSSIFSSWLPGKGQNSMGLIISNLSSLCSLTTLDISYCNISDGGALCNLGCLSSLVELNLSGNNFINIPAPSISGLTGLIRLELVGCRKLVSFPELPQCIEEVHADECTSLESRDKLVKYPMLRRVYLGQCSLRGADDSIPGASWRIKHIRLTREWSLKNISPSFYT